jgi:molybdopterin-guanine dinucleotide biosynthesis protein A
MKTAAVIVAGGRSTRMGRQKALVTVHGHSIISRILTRISPQVEAVVINVRDDPRCFDATGLRVILDIHRDAGTPLAGVHAALAYAVNEGFDTVLTVPSDCPFLPHDLASRLAAAGRAAAIASSGGQPHYLTALWSVDLFPAVTKALEELPLPRLQDWTGRCNAAHVEWPISSFDPFFNVNTPEDLAEAERIAEEFAP